MSEYSLMMRNRAPACPTKIKGEIMRSENHRRVSRQLFGEESAFRERRKPRFSIMAKCAHCLRNGRQWHNSADAARRSCGGMRGSVWPVYFAHQPPASRISSSALLSLVFVPEMAVALRGRC